MLKTKLAAIAVILTLAGIVLNFAHSSSVSARDEVSEMIANYKTWKQIQKPAEKKPDAAAAPETIMITNSTAMG